MKIKMCVYDPESYVYLDHSSGKVPVLILLLASKTLLQLTSAVSPASSSDGMMSVSPSFIACSSSFTHPTIMNVAYSLFVHVSVYYSQMHTSYSGIIQIYTCVQMEIFVVQLQLLNTVGSWKIL